MFLIMITFLHPLLFMVIATDKVLGTLLSETLSQYVLLVLLPLILYIFFVLVLISFKDRYILKGGIIGSIIGFLFTFLFFSEFGEDFLWWFIKPLALSINYFVELIIGGPCHECWGILLIYPGLFILSFSLVGVVIGKLIKKRK